MRIAPLRDENAGAHRYAAVTSVGAMSIDLAAVTDGCERGLRAVDQFGNREREEGAINGAKPEGGYGLMLALSAVEGVRISFGSASEAHVDDEPHTELTQSVIIVEGGCVADEEIIGDLGEVHAGNRITG